MKKYLNMIITGAVLAGAVMFYMRLSSMGPESESEAPPPSQPEAAATETKPAATETPAKPEAAAAPAPAAAEKPAAETPAATPAAPASPPATVTSTPSTTIAAQPAMPAPAPAATTPPVATTAAQPAPSVAATPAPAAPAATTTAPAAPAMPAAPTPAAPAPAPAPAATQPAVAAANPPVQVATATPPPAPAQPAQPPKPLAQLTPDDWIAWLPVKARNGYRQARANADTKGDMMGMRSWLSMWRRYVADPTRALIELDMARLLLQNKGEQQKNQAQAKTARKGNLTEAKLLTSSVRIRYANNPEMMELADKTDQDIDKELTQLK